MQIEVIDPHQGRRQRLRAVFVVRALRVLEKLAPGILRLVALFRDHPLQDGATGHECQVEVSLSDGTRFRAEARSGRLVRALDVALRRLSRRIEAAQARRLVALPAAPG